MSLKDLPIHKNFVMLKKLLSDKRTNPASFGKGHMDFQNKRLVSDDGTRAVQWSEEKVGEVELVPPVDVSTLKKRAKPAKPAKVKKARTGKSKSKRAKTQEIDVPLFKIELDPNRPQPPAAETIPAGMAWVRRNLPATISTAMPEDIRPNGPGRIMTIKEAKLHGTGFWDIVESNQPLLQEA